MSNYKNKLGQSFTSSELTELNTHEHKFSILESGIFFDTAISSSLTTQDFTSFRTDMFKLRFPEKVWTKETTSLLPFYHLS